MKVFLGGTVNGSKWRERLIPHLKIDFFDPVVPQWTQSAYEEELRERENCDICLYVITPKLEGVYSIAEVADDSNKRPEKTAFCILKDDEGEHFTPRQLKSLRKVGELVVHNGAYYFEEMEPLIQFLNQFQGKHIPS